MRLAKSASISLIAKLIGFIIAIPTSIIVARYLGPSGKGVFAVLMTVTGIVLQLGNLGFHSSSVYFAAKYNEKTSSIASILILFGASIGLASGLGMFLLSYIFPKAILGDIPRLFLLVALIGLPFAFVAQFLQNLFLGMQRIYEYNFVDLAAKFASLGGIIILFFFFRKGVLTLLGLTTLIAILTCLAFLSLIKQQVHLTLKFDRSVFRGMLRYGFKAYLSALFAFLVIRSDMILINYFLGTKAAGLYSLAVGSADWLLLVPATVGAMLFPKATAIADETSELTRKVSRHIVVLMVFLCIAVAIVIKPVIVFVFGQAFAPSAGSLLLLLPGIFFLSLEMIYMQDFAARGMPPIGYISPALGFLVNIALNLVLIPRYGLLAASVTSSMAYFLMFVVNLVYLKATSGSSYSDILILKPGEFGEFVAMWRNKLVALRAG
jgi:O-antigen/teichoic acid export membrane protein